MSTTLEKNHIYEQAEEELKLNSIRKSQEVQGFLNEGNPSLHWSPEKALDELSNELGTGENAQRQTCATMNSLYYREPSHHQKEAHNALILTQLVPNMKRGMWA